MIVSPHLVFESLGYFVGGQVFWWQRRRLGDPIEGVARLVVVAAAIFGAAIGAKLLSVLENPSVPSLQGKTVVGGFLGGLIGVEVMKKLYGITRSTGDAFALPLTVGTAIGRVGCYAAGMEDGTFGSPTSLPWGHNYGDGVARHPTQIYEMVFLMLLGAVLVSVRTRMPREGDLFRLFMVAYMSFRFVVDFLKPGVPLAGLTAIQWACAAALLYYSRDIRRWVTGNG
jgi:prolipoprotein diacylglyceryltransferase